MKKQSDVGLIAEMMHTASLYHDDVLDAADLRRGRESINRKFGEVAAVHVGGYSCGLANWMLAKIGDEDVLTIMASVMAALVDGELQQAAAVKHGSAYAHSSIIRDVDIELFLGSKSGDDHAKMLCGKYLLKSYNKTASLMANSCKAVATLAVKSRGRVDNEAKDIVDAASGFGRDIGICFQMVDDALDFEANEEDVGKPVGADLKYKTITTHFQYATLCYVSRY